MPDRVRIKILIFLKYFFLWVIIGIVTTALYTTYVSLAKIIPTLLTKDFYSATGIFISLALMFVGFILVSKLVFFTKYTENKFWRYLRRLDIIGVSVFGFVFGVAILHTFSIYLSNTTIESSLLGAIIILCLIMLITTVIYYVGSLANTKLDKKIENTNLYKESTFYKDTEIYDQNDDLLNYKERAQDFSKRIYDNKSNLGLVFGIDAPWGMGKSSFINFVVNDLFENYNEIIVYKFNPAQYRHGTNLSDKFIRGLTSKIKEHVFNPELISIINLYAQSLELKARPKLTIADTFGLLGVSLSLPFLGKDISVTRGYLETLFDNLKYKIVIIIDDLDRIGPDEAVRLLLEIRQNFNMPFVSYVLCYDTNNIAGHHSGIIENKEKFIEFTEKYINAKFGIYPEPILLRNAFDELSSDFSNRLHTSMSGKTGAELELLPLVSGLLTSRKFFFYRHLIGNLRKLKRLLNTILLFYKNDPEIVNCDIDWEDMLHLTLLYLNHPDVFKDIYNAEYNGSGFFSVINEYDEHDDFYKENGVHDFIKDKEESIAGIRNTNTFVKYLKDVEYESAKFLLREIFDVNRNGIYNFKVENLTDKQKAEKALFNGDRYGQLPENLKMYIGLIAHNKLPNLETQNTPYLRLYKKIQDNPSFVSKTMFDEKPFYQTGESSHTTFWRYIAKHFYEFSDTQHNLINLLLNYHNQYSILELKKINLGLRDDVDYLLVKMLEDVHIKITESGKDKQTGFEQVKLEAINKLIFDDGGVIDTLASDDGVLGIFDVLAFRLYCAPGRGGNVYEIQRALWWHAKKSSIDNIPDTKTYGDIMREITQKIFGICKERYISKDINIFSEIYNLRWQDTVGAYENYVTSKKKTGDITENNLTEALLKLRVQLSSFIIYQLTSSKIESHVVPVGCFDAIGLNDKSGIAVEMKKYLFDVCFNPKINKNNIRYFIDYLMCHFESTMHLPEYREHNKYVPNYKKWIDIIGHNELRIFWKANSEEIRKYANRLKEYENPRIVTANYYTTYKDDLDAVFNELDKGTIIESVQN